MYQNIPVRIPEIPGKISLQKKNDTVYVRYVLRRTYDRERKMTLPEYKVIGVQIERMPSLMLPNENYEVYFDQEGKERAAEQILREAAIAVTQIKDLDSCSTGSTKRAEARVLPR